VAATEAPSHTGSTDNQDRPIMSRASSINNPSGTSHHFWINAGGGKRQSSHFNDRQRTTIPTANGSIQSLF
jgi:hypothetical protein